MLYLGLAAFQPTIRLPSRRGFAESTSRLPICEYSASLGCTRLKISPACSGVVWCRTMMRSSGEVRSVASST
jgi:hypothetical protein